MAEVHGTIAAYRRCPTKCDNCRAAMAAHGRQRRRMIAYRRPTTDMVDAAPVHAHIADLRASRMGIGRIASKAGLTASSVQHLVDRGSTRVRPATAEKILAVVADPCYVDAAPTWRLIHGIVARGYPMITIARMLGRSSTTCLTFGETQVRAETAVKVRALAEQCAITPGPSDAACRMAERNGWQVAWLWEDLPCSRNSEAA